MTAVRSPFTVAANWWSLGTIFPVPTMPLAVQNAFHCFVT